MFQRFINLFRPASVDSILADLNTKIVALNKRADVERDAALREQEQIDELHDSIQRRMLEASRANRIAERVKALVD